MKSWTREFGYAVRTLRKNPGYAVVAIATLAIAMGATTALFTVVSAVLLRPLPYPDSASLVALWEFKDGQPRPVNAGNFADWRERARSFSSMAVVDLMSFNLSGEGSPERVRGARVSAAFFSLLGTAPLHGRTLEAGDERPGQEHVVVLGHRLWQRHFNGDPQVVGHVVRLDDVPHTIVGVMPRGFDFPYLGDLQDLWTPRLISEQERSEAGRRIRRLAAVARLAPGVSFEAAASELAAVAQQLEKEHPVANAGWSARVTDLYKQAVKRSQGTLLLLQGAVGLLLLIAVANVVNLTLARNTVRQREIALRVALGAGRSQVIRQLVTESTVLSLAAGALGLAFSTMFTRLLLRLEPGKISRLDEVTVDWRVFGFALLVSLVCGLVLGLVPGLAVFRLKAYEALKQGGGKSTGGRSHRWLRNLLLTFETALVLVLLVGGGLMLAGFQRLLTLDPGFETKDRAALHLVLPRQKFPDRAQIATFLLHLEERLRAIPGVRAVGVGTTIPLALEGGLTLGFVHEGKPADPSNVPLAGFDVVSPDYFRALGMQLVRGRLFDSRDQAGGLGVLVINETMAKRFWPGEEALGKRVQIRDPQGPWVEVVGIVGDVHYQDLIAEPRPAMYQPYTQMAITWPGADLVVEAEPGQMATLAPLLRKAVWEIDGDQAVDLRTLEQVERLSLARQRFQMVLLGLFALVALVLAALGIYGVVSYAVSQDRQQIGLRMALGAQREEILRWAAIRGLLPVFAGIVLGIAAALALSGLVGKLIRGVSATDPMVFALVALLLLAVAAVATYVPARRATRVDPLIALRQD